MPKFSDTSPAAAEAAAKAYRGWEARKIGATWDQVAKTAGYANRGAAYNAVMGLIKELKQEAAEDLVILEEERLDSYLRALAPGIAKGEPAAINAALKISERRAKLRGLDDFDRRMAELQERRVRIEERDAVAVATMLANVVRKLELPPEQTQLARELVKAELQALGSAPDVVRGELA
ncbi:hypothetical protein SEA_SONALI_1 [Arthrobacter phage Sonali]|uniref:Terminase small subunit n=1 Tax=Arthrobacter phage Sonali TaxID=2510495 RepID=A0A411CQB7_9CAUD|nr:Rnase E [Arthrobacter phage Sonali]QAY16114.1 hypothetical protein SEA_SONALI_1 [Arthrobacter phage Sonali]